MSGSVIAMPDRPVDTARAVLARPEGHSALAQLMACRTLLSHGGPNDQRRAAALYPLLVRLAVAEIEREERRGFWPLRTVWIGLLTVNFAAVATLIYLIALAFSL